MVHNERSIEEFQAVHNNILEILRVSTGSQHSSYFSLEALALLKNAIYTQRTVPLPLGLSACLLSCLAPRVTLITCPKGHSSLASLLIHYFESGWHVGGRVMTRQLRELSLTVESSCAVRKDRHPSQWPPAHVWRIQGQLPVFEEAAEAAGQRLNGDRHD